MTIETEFLTTKDAARLMGFSFKTLEAWRAAGSGPEYLRLKNGRIRYKRSAIEVWLDPDAPGSTIQ